MRAIDSVALPLTGYTAADSTAAAIEGWDGLVLSRGTTADDATQTLYAYTDIAGAPGETFVMRCGGQLTLNMPTADKNNVGLADSGSFPSAAQPVRVFNNISTCAGTFDGVPGMFTFSAVAGTIEPDDATGGLSFANATRIL